MTTLTTKVKELALANNMDYFGITPVDRLQNEPEDFGPTDFLPRSRSIVVMGIRLSLGVQLANKLAYQGSRQAIYTYLWHGFGMLNMHFLDRTALLVTRLLEKEGYIATPIQSSSPVDIRGSVSGFSNMHAAVAAGLGEMGWNGFALTPDVGPRARFVSIITTAELDPDPMYVGPKLCDPEKCRQLGEGQPLCVKVCPVAALTTDGSQDTVIAEASFGVAELDENRCMWASMGLSEGSLAQQSIPMPDKVELTDIYQALNELEPGQSLETMVFRRGDYCGKCIMVCPVGSPEIVDELASKARK